MGELSLLGVNVNRGMYEDTPDTSKGDNATNYFRNDRIFGNIGNPERNILSKKGILPELTKSTPWVDKVLAKVQDNGASARDLQPHDILAKQFGASGKIVKGSEAEAAFLRANAGDFSARINESGQPEAFFDKNKSDGWLRMFSHETRNGQEFRAIRYKYQGKMVTEFFDCQGKKLNISH